MNTYDLNTICENNENKFSETLNLIDSMDLTEVKDVTDSCIVSCYAEELLKILKLDVGVIRKSIFDDNVRDFQGDSNVNCEIKSTLKDEPEKFAILNNGITIVCSDYSIKNRKITIKNPRIINGCQTSSVLFYTSEEGVDASRHAPICIKVISTTDHDIINKIVRSSNKQNIVYEEAFETTRDFHKNLEKYFSSSSIGSKKIYYERRSKQYVEHPFITQFQKINLKFLVQSFVGMFLNRPHMSHKHESIILKNFKDDIFLNNQSLHPYYVSAVTLYFLEAMFRNQEINMKYSKYKHHLLMLFRELIIGRESNINNETQVDEHCHAIVEVLESNYKEVFRNAISIFETCEQQWIRMQCSQVKQSSTIRLLIVMEF